MSVWEESYDGDFGQEQGMPSLYLSDGQWTDDTDCAEAFFCLVRQLQKQLPVKKALLVLREEAHSRYCVVASFSGAGTRKNLSLRLPGHSSLIAKVAEHRSTYTESYCGLFSGSTFERNLLLDDDSQSFALMPLIFAGEVVGVLGLSSDQPHAFVTVEASGAEQIATPLAAHIGRINSLEQ